MKEIGIEVEKPEKECEDKNCPFHGTLKVRGNFIEGKVVSDKGEKTAVVVKTYTKKVPKYERYERRKSKIPVHNPPCINAQTGDKVLIGECKPISKSKSFVIVEKREEK